MSYTWKEKMILNKWAKNWFSRKPDEEKEAYNYKRKAHEIPDNIKNVLPKSRNMTEYTMQCQRANKRLKQKNPY